jgi:ATP-dependent helicase/nuclease subunit B
VTPDRLLARRVAVRLEAWGLRVEDSAGQAFAKTAVGGLLDLAVEAAAKRFEPVALVSLLKHPLCRLGMPAAELRRAVRALELAAFRTPYFGQGAGRRGGRRWSGRRPICARASAGIARSAT